MMEKRIRKQAGGLRPDKYLSEWQQQCLLDYVVKKAAGGGHRAAANLMIVEMLMLTGLRAAELCYLTMKDLPMRHGKPVVFVECGKGRKERTVEIPTELMRRIGEFAAAHRVGARAGSPMFVSERGGIMSTQNLRAKLRLIGYAAGIGHLHPHKLRHTYGTNAYNITGDLLFLQDQMGHADPRTTAIYARTNDRRRRQHAENIGTNLYDSLSKHTSALKSDCNVSNDKGLL